MTLVKVGRVTAVAGLVIAVAIAPLLGNLDQAFQFIQEFTGFVSPGALAIFLVGFFWKRANAQGAIAAAVGTFVFSLLMWLLLPEVSFLDRMGYVFLACVLLMLIFGWKSKVDPAKVVVIDPKLFRTTTVFKALSLCIIVILSCIYYIFW